MAGNDTQAFADRLDSLPSMRAGRSCSRSSALVDVAGVVHPASGRWRVPMDSGIEGRCEAQLANCRSDEKQGGSLAGEEHFFGMPRVLVGMRIDLEHCQRFSQLLALNEGRGPVTVVAAAVEAQTLAGEQAVGNRGDGDF
jgi:hypothetical protein